jgi:two-component system sensor histidine kinase KdpD
LIGLYLQNMEKSVKHFLDLIRDSRKGKFKIYIGMISGVGKTYRMLQDLKQLIDNGIDARIGFIETHNRYETERLTTGLPLIPRKSIYYHGKELEEMDLDSIIRIHPEVVIVDELAHSNIEGSKNEKRWQDVFEILESGISVISAVNIQHIESLYQEVKTITGIEVHERIPDSVIARADEVVNIDLTAQELIDRLKQGKIYSQDKIEMALHNFFQSDHILQLRELALKEVAMMVEKKVDQEIREHSYVHHESFLACIGSNGNEANRIIRKVARLATRYNESFSVLHVKTKNEMNDKISLLSQRHLINEYKLASQLGAEVIQIETSNIVKGIIEVCENRNITTVCIGRPSFKLSNIIIAALRHRHLLYSLNKKDIDILILS